MADSAPPQQPQPPPQPQPQVQPPCGACYSRKVACRGLQCPFFLMFPMEKADHFQLLVKRFGEPAIRGMLAMDKKSQQAALKKMSAEARAHETLKVALQKAYETALARISFLEAKNANVPAVARNCGLWDDEVRDDNFDEEEHQVSSYFRFSLIWQLAYVNVNDFLDNML